MYYSFGATTIARLTWLHFQDIWPCDYYNGDVHDRKNPLRCIFNNNKKKTTYFENMFTPWPNSAPFLQLS